LETGDDSRYAVHLVLARGDNSPFHSRILWWRGEFGGAFHGGEWGWKIGSESCGGPFPSDSFVALPIGGPGEDVFCGSNSMLGDGRLMVAGGSAPDAADYGENKARIYTRGSGSSAGSWSTPADMNEWRWYPSTAILRDGRMAVAGGERYPHHRIFGGKLNGAAPSSPSGDTLRRFAPVLGGAWEPLVAPSPDPATHEKPAPREGHTFVELTQSKDFLGQVMFGGRNSAGQPLNDTWLLQRQGNATDTDYVYSWNKIISSETPPPPRGDHTAIVAGDAMIVFGGRDTAGVVASNVFRLSKDLSGYHWAQVNVTGQPPSGRFGHAAIYDTTYLTSEQTTPSRMIVFGGTTAVGTTPTDRSIYELRFDSPTSAHWNVLTQVNLGSPGPAPRYWHSLTADPWVRLRGSQWGHTAYLFGGRLDRAFAGGVDYSDSLWALWIFRDGTVGWELRTPLSGGQAPSARARHTAVLDKFQGAFNNHGSGRLYILGGENGSGAADKFIYTVDSLGSATTNHWQAWKDDAASHSGHTAIIDEKVTLSRFPEVYSPGSNTWTRYTSAPLLSKDTYPLIFSVAGNTTGGGRLISVGHDPKA
jgi:hypothetical protein